MSSVRVVRSPIRNAIVVAAAVIACGDRSRVTAPGGLELVEAPQAAQAHVCEVSWAAPVSGLWTDATKWDPQVVPTTNDDVCITVDGSYTVDVRGAQVANTVTIGHPDNAGTQTLLIQAFNITSSLTAADGMTNHGTITLAWNRGTNGQAAVLASTGGTVVNSGLIQTVTDAVSAPRVIAANLLNLGTVLIGHITTLNKANAVYENRGTFTIPDNRTLNMVGNIGQTFRQTDGTLDVSGSFGLPQSTFEFNGGNITGDGIVITSGTLAIAEGNEGTGGFTIRGASMLQGDIAAAQHILIQAFNATSTLTSATGFTNAGRIDMRWDRSQNGHAAVLAVTDGVLTNSGTIETFTDAVGAPRIIAASLTNTSTGRVLIGHLTTFNKPNAIYENHGTFTMPLNRPATFNGAGGVFKQIAGTLTALGTTTFQGQTVEVAGGTIVGRPIINDGMLRFLDGCDGSGDFSVRGANAKLDGDIPAGYTVRINTNGAVTSVLTAAEGFTNAGTIEFQPGGSGSNNGTATNIAVTTGALTNTGTIRVLSDAFGGTGRLFLASVVNRAGGTIDIRTRFVRFQKTDGAHVNEGTILLNNTALTISGLNQTLTHGPTGTVVGGGNGGVLALSGITLRASGAIAAHLDLTNVAAHIGSDGPATLAVTGNYRMITGGSLNVELTNDPTPGTGHDRLNVSGTATLLGTLSVTAVAGQCLDPNLSFQIMAMATRAGDFAIKNGLNLGGGRSLVAVPAPTSYKLNSQGPPCAAPDATAPIIAPTVTGTQGNDGWYVSDVTVTWSVTDDESDVTSQVGCENQSVTTDTDGMTYTCTATSAGGTAEQSVTIRRDATAPVVSATLLSDNLLEWYPTPVGARYSATDAMSGLVGTSPVLHLFDTEGANQSHSHTFTDVAGNSATGTVSGVNIDLTPPTWTASASPTPNAAGWNNTDVTVTFTLNDALSGIEGPTTVTFVFDQEGANQVQVRDIRDVAGQSAQLVYRVSIDKTAPAVTVTRFPLPDANGWNSTSVTATWNATDALSGIDGAATFQQLFDQDGANQGGSHTFADRAGNSASATISGINIDRTPLAASCSVTPSDIWPANNKMVAARVTISGTGIESYRLRSVSNNETGSSDVEGWSIGSADLEGFVRASRNGSGGGRVYSLTYDVFGRSTSTSCTVTIRLAHDQRGR